MFNFQVQYFSSRKRLKLKLQAASTTNITNGHSTVIPATTSITTTSLVDRKEYIPQTTAKILSTNSSLSSPGILSAIRPHLPGISPIVAASSGTIIKNVSSRKDSTSSDQGNNFLPPPCGDSFFEESMTLPSTLATFKERNSPSINQSLPTSTDGKKFSFKKPGIPSASMSSTPAVQRTASFCANTSPTNYIPELDDLDNYPTTTQPKTSNFSFDYKISEDSGGNGKTDHNEKSNFSLGKVCPSFAGEDSFNWDDVPSDIEECLRSPVHHNRSVAAITSAVSPNMNNSRSSFSASKSPGWCMIRTKDIVNLISLFQFEIG
jgi:hypothetical protein